MAKRLRTKAKAPSGGTSTWEWSGEPPKESWDYANELVNTAFVKATNEGRALPNTDDWVYAREIANGEAEANWWDSGLLTA